MQHFFFGEWGEQWQNHDSYALTGAAVPLCDDIILLASYNATMNRKVYDAAATLTHEAIVADRGAFFGSLLGTLNHLVAGDTIWLTRFAGHRTAFRALDALRGGVVPSDLRQSYGETIALLRTQRERVDGIITALAQEVSNEDLAQVLVYQNTRGVRFSKPFGSLLLHLFNHQTHHRGQASTLLTQAGVDIGVTDLLMLIEDRAPV
jgi:uncharacterized damage-inducible protein DinB